MNEISCPLSRPRPLMYQERDIIRKKENLHHWWKMDAAFRKDRFLLVMITVFFNDIDNVFVFVMAPFLLFVCGVFFSFGSFLVILFLFFIWHLVIHVLYFVVIVLRNIVVLIIDPIFGPFPILVPRPLAHPDIAFVLIIQVFFFSSLAIVFCFSLALH